MRGEAKGFGSICKSFASDLNASIMMIKLFCSFTLDDITNANRSSFKCKSMKLFNLITTDNLLNQGITSFKFLRRE